MLHGEQAKQVKALRFPNRDVEISPKLQQKAATRSKARFLPSSQTVLTRKGQTFRPQPQVSITTAHNMP